MTQYATLTDLIQRAGGDEIVQRGLSGLRLRYRKEVATAAGIADAIGDPRDDDVVLALDDGLLYRYEDEVWTFMTTARITQALTDASAVADGYLRGRYELPLAETPPELTMVVCDLARYYLYDDQAKEAAVKRYEQAIAWLKSVSAGVVTLDSTAAVPDEDGTGSANISGHDRVFSRDNMSGF